MSARITRRHGNIYSRRWRSPARLARNSTSPCVSSIWRIRDIKLGQLAAARAGLREGLALAQRLGALPWVVGAVMDFADLAHAEGQTERALALLGLARNQPAWSSDHQRELDATLAEWALDPSVVEAGLKKGEALDWDETVKELLRA